MQIRISLDKSDWEEILKVLEKSRETQSTSGSNKTGFSSSGTNAGKASINRGIDTIRRLLQEQTATLDRQE